MNSAASSAIIGFLLVCWMAVEAMIQATGSARNPAQSSSCGTEMANRAFGTRKRDSGDAAIPGAYAAGPLEDSPSGSPAGLPQSRSVARLSSRTSPTHP